MTPSVRGTTFRTFFARRAVRIFPLYYGVLLVLLLLTRPLHLDWQGQAYRLWTYTPNIPFHNDWTQNPPATSIFWHFWSLAVEEQFYLLCRCWSSGCIAGAGYSPRH